MGVAWRLLLLPPPLPLPLLPLPLLLLLPPSPLLLPSRDPDDRISPSQPRRPPVRTQSGE